MDEPVGTPDSDDRSDSVPKRLTWNNILAMALSLISIAGFIYVVLSNAYYSGLIEGLSMLPVTEVNHE